MNHVAIWIWNLYFIAWVCFGLVDRYIIKYFTKNLIKITFRDASFIWVRHLGQGQWTNPMRVTWIRLLSFIFLRSPVLDSQVCWDLRCHGKSQWVRQHSGGLVVWLTGELAVLGSGERKMPRSAFRQRGVDWPRGPTQRQLPTAGCVEGGCSQGVKLQALCNMETPDTS